MTAQSQLNCLRRLQSFQCRQMTISVSQWLSPWSSFLPLAKSSDGRATLQSNPMPWFSGPRCFIPVTLATEPASGFYTRHQRERESMKDSAGAGGGGPSRSDSLPKFSSPQQHHSHHRPHCKGTGKGWGGYGLAAEHSGLCHANALRSLMVTKIEIWDWALAWDWVPRV